MTTAFHRKLQEFIIAWQTSNSEEEVAKKLADKGWRCKGDYQLYVRDDNGKGIGFRSYSEMGLVRPTYPYSVKAVKSFKARNMAKRGIELKDFNKPSKLNSELRCLAASLNIQ